MMLNQNDYEILIINDFSEDQTENIANELALNNTKIKFINNNIHLGFGGSFIKALKFVKKEFIYLIPGDNALPSDVIKKMLTNINDFDLIFGSSKLNLKIVEVPIRYDERKYAETQISRFRHGWLLLKMVLFAYKKLKII